jgi:hypothetical protein
MVAIATKDAINTETSSESKRRLVDAWGKGEARGIFTRKLSIAGYTL